MVFFIKEYVYSQWTKGMQAPELGGEAGMLLVGRGVVHGGQLKLLYPNAASGPGRQRQEEVAKLRLLGKSS